MIDDPFSHLEELHAFLREGLDHGEIPEPELIGLLANTIKSFDAQFQLQLLKEVLK